ncbi:unnamed protein product, partial [Didymodactylos carnosus]
GRCRVTHYQDIVAAKDFTPYPDTFFYILTYNPEARRLANTQGEIRVGPSHQAKLPVYKPSDDDIPEKCDDYESPIWRNKISDIDLSMYLQAARSIAAFAGMCHTGKPEDMYDVAQRDDTTINALTVLHNHDYDCKKGIQALVKCPIGPKGIDRKWSDDDQKKFIKGLRQYGKNFYRIRKEHLPLKETGDLVEYYYLWKKTQQAQNSRPRRRIIREGKSNSSSTPTNGLTSSTSSSSTTPIPTNGKRGGKTIVKTEPTVPKENNMTTTTNTNSGNSSGGSDDENNETDDSESTTVTTTTTASLTASSITYCRHCQTTSSKDFQLGGRDNHLLCYDCRMYYKKYGELPIINQDNNQNKEPPPFLFKPVNQSEQSSSLIQTNKRKRNDTKERKSNRQSPLINNEHQQDETSNNNDSTKSTRSKVKKACVPSISRSSPSTSVSDQKSPKSDNSDENEIIKNSSKRKTKTSTIIKQETDEEENTPLSMYAPKTTALSSTDKTDPNQDLSHTTTTIGCPLKSILGNESMARIDTSTTLVNSTKSIQHLNKLESLDKSSPSRKGSGFLIKTEEEESADMKMQENDIPTGLGTSHNNVTPTTSTLTTASSLNNHDNVTSASSPIMTPKPVTSMITLCKQEPLEHTELPKKHSIVNNTILYDHTKHEPHFIQSEHQTMEDDTKANILLSFTRPPPIEQLLSSPCSAFSRTLRTNNNSRSNSTNDLSVSSDKKNIISPSNIKDETENRPQSCSNSAVSDINDTLSSSTHPQHTHQTMNDLHILNSNNNTNNLPPPLVPDGINESEDGDDRESVENDPPSIDDGPSPTICETVFLNKPTSNCIVLRTYDRLQNSCARTDLTAKRLSHYKKKHQSDTGSTINRRTPTSTPLVKQEERTPSKLSTLMDTKPILNHENDLRRSSPLYFPSPLHNGKPSGYPYGDTSALRQLGDIAMRSMNPALLQSHYGARFDRPMGLDPAFLVNDRYRNLSPFNTLNQPSLPSASSSQTYPTHSHAHIHSHSHTHLHVNDPHTIPPQLMGLHTPIPGLPHPAGLFHPSLANMDALHLSRDRDFMAYMAAANGLRGAQLDPLLAAAAAAAVHQMPRHEEMNRLALGSRERTLHNDNEFRRIHLENERQQRLHYLAAQHQQDEMLSLDNKNLRREEYRYQLLNHQNYAVIDINKTTPVAHYDRKNNASNVEINQLACCLKDAIFSKYISKYLIIKAEEMWSLYETRIEKFVKEKRLNLPCDIRPQAAIMLENCVKKQQDNIDIYKRKIEALCSTKQHDQVPRVPLPKCIDRYNNEDYDYHNDSREEYLNNPERIRTQQQSDVDGDVKKNMPSIPLKDKFRNCTFISGEVLPFDPTSQTRTIRVTYQCQE